VLDLSPGVYTFVVSGVGGTTGVGLMENFDATSQTYTRFTSLSSRQFVGTGGNVAISGFIISGTKPRRVCLRGLGPSLATKGIANYLANPQLVLFNSANQQISSNDDWANFGGTAFQEDLSVRGRAPSYSNEAVIVATLDPGSYTVQLSGVNNTTGIGQIEVLEY